jgi:thiamine biosynthesis lipoprotein
MIRRRRLLTLAAAAALAPALPARARPIHQWRGVALGADASITLAHPDAPRIVERALAEIARLEGVFSLHRPDSALARLNATGHLAAPPFELLECLGLCGRVHAATGGAFSPSGRCMPNTMPQCAQVRSPPPRWPPRWPAPAGGACGSTRPKSGSTPAWRSR